MSSPKNPAFAEIDLDRLHHNLDLISERASVPMAPVIKANAYGHGAIPIAHELLRRKDVSALAVYSVAEAEELRKDGIMGRIIGLGGFAPEETKMGVALGIEPVISDLATAKRIARAANKPVSVHFKINTGMTRFGVEPEEAVATYRSMAAMRKIRIVGLMTHFADAENSDSFTRQQIEIFDDVCRSLATSGQKLPPRHAANSAAIFRHANARYDMVRPGISIYGMQTFPGRNRGLKPVLSLKARLVTLRSIKKSTSVSYGMTWKSNRPRIVGLVPVGYADGYVRMLSNKAHAIINGVVVRQVGTICMDNCLFDVSNAKAKTGDIVTLIGESNGKSVNAMQLATWAGTIPYEIVCGIGRRIVRHYLKKGSKR